MNHGARGTEERALTSSENKSTFETHCETDEYFHCVHQCRDVDDCRTHTRGLRGTYIDGVSFLQQAQGTARSLRVPVPLVPETPKIAERIGLSIRTVVSVILDSRRRTSMETRCVRESDASYQCGKVCW